MSTALLAEVVVNRRVMYPVDESMMERQLHSLEKEDRASDQYPLALPGGIESETRRNQGRFFGPDKGRRHRHSWVTRAVQRCGGASSSRKK
jgi:hypothetical protein